MVERDAVGVGFRVIVDGAGGPEALVEVGGDVAGVGEVGVPVAGGVGVSASGLAQGRTRSSEPIAGGRIDPFPALAIDDGEGILVAVFTLPSFAIM